MSKLQYQLRELLPKLSSEAKKTTDPEIKKHFYLVKAVGESRKSVKVACESRGESTKVFYKWANRLLETERLESLRNHSKRPHHSPKQIDSRIEKRILRIRRKQPYMGPEQIRFELSKKWKSKTPHPSTVYQALRRNGLIKKEYRKKLTKKHMKRYRRPIPGYLQMDFKYVPYAIAGLQYYQLSCIDHHSSWRLIRYYKHKDLIAVEDFLFQLERYCPFKIIQIQTDNDKSFTDKYRVGTDGYATGEHALDDWCKDHEVEHRLIPIGQKELNGKVENSHKWDDREFFSQVHPENLSQLQAAGFKHELRWNYSRPTKTLDWLTPHQVLYQARAFQVFWNLWFQKIKEDANMTMTRIDKNGNTYIPIKKVKLKPNRIKKAKTLSDLDRCLSYLNGKEKNSQNSLPMSPNFSAVGGDVRCEICRSLPLWMLRYP